MFNPSVLFKKELSPTRDQVDTMLHSLEWKAAIDAGVDGQPDCADSPEEALHDQLSRTVFEQAKEGRFDSYTFALGRRERRVLKGALLFVSLQERNVADFLIGQAEEPLAEAEAEGIRIWTRGVSREAGLLRYSVSH